MELWNCGIVELWNSSRKKLLAAELAQNIITAVRTADMHPQKLLAAELS